MRSNPRKEARPGGLGSRMSGKLRGKGSWESERKGQERREFTPYIKGRSPGNAQCGILAVAWKEARRNPMCKLQPLNY